MKGFWQLGGKIRGFAEGGIKDVKIRHKRKGLKSSFEGVANEQMEYCIGY